MPDEIKRELLAIADALDGLLRWESDLSGEGFPTALVAEDWRHDVHTASSVGHVGRSRAPRAMVDVISAPTPPVPAVALGGPERQEGPGGAERREPPLALPVLQAQAAACTACGLHQSRTTSVFARGNPQAELVFVGEGPGYHEDQSGEPFVGQAGQLLDKMIVAMGYGRDDVYICNVVKCRPPDNRTPLPDEAAACEPFLRGQIANVGPRAIVTLGKCATESLGCMSEGQKRWRGLWSEYDGIPVMPTYHPAFLLRSPQFKRDVWEDLQQVMSKLGRAQ